MGLEGLERIGRRGMWGGQKPEDVGVGVEDYVLSCG